MVMLLLISTL